MDGLTPAQDPACRLLGSGICSLRMGQGRRWNPAWSVKYLPVDDSAALSAHPPASASRAAFRRSALVHAFGFIPAQKPEFTLLRAVRVRASIKRNAASKRVHALDDGVPAARFHHGGLHAPLTLT